MLGVTRDASTAEIRRAYRRQALLYHPDKNVGSADAEERFRKVAVAYDILSDERRRARYDRGESSDADLYGGFDGSRASDMFNAHFGQELMQQWKPGHTVSGTLIVNGKWFSITIGPDGKAEEQEHSGGTGVLSRLIEMVSYSSMTIEMPGGHRVRAFHFATRVGQALAARLVPFDIARQPLAGPLAMHAVSWLPTVLVGALGYAAVRLTRRAPGAMPDILADAFAAARM